MEYFTIKMHHGGRFVDLPKKEYVDGSIRHWDNCQSDYRSFFEVEDLVERTGYKSYKGLWYTLNGTSLDKGLRPILNDTDAMDMAQIGIVYGVVEMYLVSEERPCIENMIEDAMRGIEEHKKGDEEVEDLN